MHGMYKTEHLFAIHYNYYNYNKTNTVLVFWSLPNSKTSSAFDTDE